MPTKSMADNWYEMADVFHAAPAWLRSGSMMLRSDTDLFGGRLCFETGYAGMPHADTGEYRYARFSLSGVAPDLVDGLPDTLSLSRLVRHNILCLPEARFARDLVIRHRRVDYVSTGVVCVSLKLVNEDHFGVDVTAKRREVETAYNRGLLDVAGRSKADFRLAIRPMVQKLEALRDSEYLPEGEWRIDIEFAGWRERDSGDWVLTPLADDSEPDEISLCFTERQRFRGFRVADLFTG